MKRFLAISVFLGGCLLLWGQFREVPGLYGGIETANYFASLLGAMVATVWLVKPPAILYRGEVAVFALFVYLMVHVYATRASESREFYLSISYFALYAVFRVVKGMRLGNCLSLALLLGGIWQAGLVLGQLFGFESSHHIRFAVTGSFFNPGPCGIFLSGVFVLAVAVVRKGYRRMGMNLMFVRYAVACVAFGAALVAMVPTMSRAGWLGALVGTVLLYRREIAGRLRRCRRWMVGAGVAGLLVLLAVFYLFKKDSADGRLFIWRNTVEACLSSPFFGVGIDGFERAYAETQHDFFAERDVLVQDCRYTELAGVVESAFNEPLALVLLLGFAGGSLAVTVLYFKLRRLTEYGCVAVALLVSSLFSYTFYIPSVVLLFLFALSQLPDRRIGRVRWVNAVMYGMMGVVALFFGFREYGHREVYREWKTNSIYYTGKDYRNAVDSYASCYPALRNDFRYLFEYGHSLHKAGHYEESNAILKRGTRYSADPMFWNVMGNNYLALKEYDLARQAYLRAYYTCPNRVYPLYLLTKLEAARKDTAGMHYYGRLLLEKRPKVPSTAVEEMKFEVRKILFGE